MDIEIRNKLVKVIKWCGKKSVLDCLNCLFNYFILGKNQSFQVTTVHLAVVLLDLYFVEYIVSESEDHQTFLALVTLLLAAKSEDLDERIPSTKDLLCLIDLSPEIGLDLRSSFEEHFPEEELKRAYRLYNDLYCKLEFIIFECSKFNTIRPTPVHFLQAFQNITVTEQDLGDLKSDQRVIESIDDLRLFANEYFRQFLNIILEKVEFNTILPSRCAAGVIASTRKLIGIKSIWSPILEKQLRCNYKEIEVIVDELLRLKVMEEATQVKVDDDNMSDSGCYGSECMEENKSIVEIADEDL